MGKTHKHSLAITFPELAAQADGWDPTSITAGSGRKLPWICQDGHRWQSSVTNRTKGSGCPFCSGLRPTVGENDLATTHPELAAQADGWDPTTLSAGSAKKVGWKCNFGHKWKAPVINRRNTTSCPVCLSLATTHPQLAAQADGWDPTTLSAGSNKSVNWKCNLGHQWSSIVGNRSKGNGCPVCSGKAVEAGFNDLTTTHPELAAQADGWDTTTLTAGSGKKVGWKCNLGHKWKAPVSGRSRGHGCPVCSGRSVDTGFNDLATTHPELAAQADGWDPTTLKAGSNKKVKWKCNLGHQWLSTPNDRKGGDSCPVCSNHQTSAGFNDLATTHPELAAQADGWDPTTLSAGSEKKVGWKCELGHKWKAQVANRTNGNNCPTCMTFGFDPNQPSYLYFIEHYNLDMFQIGITNLPEDRLGRHARRGWEVIEIRGPMDGHLTRKLETSCLQSLERRGAVLGHKADVSKFDGYSEAWTKASLMVSSIKQMLDWVYEDEENNSKS